MKILSFVDSFALGGAESVTVNLALGLTGHTHRVIHFSTANGIAADSDLVSRLENAGIPCADLPWNLLSTARSRRRMLRDFEPDVVLCHWWGGAPWRDWIKSIARRLPGERPVFVCILHHHGIPAPRGYDFYVPVAHTQVAQVSAPPDRIHVIPNGVDLARFSAARLTPRREMVVGRLSNMREVKIPRNWVRTLAGFDLPATRFEIAGSGEMLRVLKADATRLGVAKKFSFPGRIAPAEVPRLLSQFDVFCYATSSAVECCPLVFLEALAAGVPIVAEARGGIPEIVKHRRNGLLASSVAEIGDHLRTLRRNPQLLSFLSDGARRSARHFSVDRQIRSYRTLLAEIERMRAESRERGIAKAS